MFRHLELGRGSVAIMVERCLNERLRRDLIMCVIRRKLGRVFAICPCMEVRHSAERHWHLQGFFVRVCLQGWWSWPSGEICRGTSAGNHVLVTHARCNSCGLQRPSILSDGRVLSKTPWRASWTLQDACWRPEPEPVSFWATRTAWARMRSQGRKSP